jgi:hypothetical protein
MVPISASGYVLKYDIPTPSNNPKHRFPPPAQFKLGDFVTVMHGDKEVPGVIIEVDHTRIASFRVGGYYKEVHYVWFDWYYREDLAHDIN